MFNIGAPSFNSLGIKDNSGVNVTPVLAANPSHLPLVFTLAQKGDYKPQYTRPGLEFQKRYGAETLKNQSKFFTHQTELIRIFSANANAMVVCRIKVPGSKTAILRLSVEVIRYQGKPRLIWHVGTSDYIPVQQPFAQGKIRSNFRSGSISAMGQTLGDVGETSTLYPVLDIIADSDGEFGNHIGFEIFDQLVNSADVNRAVLRRHLPFTIVTKVRAHANAEGAVIGGVSGQSSVTMNLFHDLSDEDALATVYERTYGAYGDNNTGVGGFHFYQSSIAQVLQTVAMSEAIDPTPLAGFYAKLAVNDASQAGLLNIFTGIAPDGVTAYNGFEVDTQGVFGGQYIGRNSTVYMSGGDDGIAMVNNKTADRLASSEAFDLGVRALLEAFPTNRDGLMDMVRFPINTIWDTGFSFPTKDAFAVPYAARKDIVPFLVPFVFADYIDVPDPEGRPPISITISQIETTGGGVTITGSLSRATLDDENVFVEFPGLDREDMATVAGTSWSLTITGVDPGTYTAIANLFAGDVVIANDTDSFTIIAPSANVLVSPGAINVGDVLDIQIAAELSTMEYTP